LTSAGIGASRSYPASLADVPELQRSMGPMTGMIGGRQVAQRILTLPTHPFVSGDDITRIGAVLRVELEGRRRRQESPAA
jgi:dTDP-4-amino-4,6-dideoxygalactose transaminase